MPILAGLEPQSLCLALCGCLQCYLCTLLCVTGALLHSAMSVSVLQPLECCAGVPLHTGQRAADVACLHGRGGRWQSLLLDGGDLLYCLLPFCL